MGISSKSNISSYQIRSISFPDSLHPNISKVVEDLKKAETREASFTLSDHAKSLSRMWELYKDVEEFLNLSVTQQMFSHYRKEKWVDQLLDGSVRVLDICCITRDIVSQIKEQVRDLQCALRRRKSESNIKSSIDRFVSFRKKIKKDITKAIANVKQVHSVIDASTINLNHHLVVAIRILTEVSEMTISILKSILLFFFVKSKPSKWSFVSKMMHKGRVGCEGQNDNVNELENVDVALLNICINGTSNEGEKIQMAQTSLKTMEASIESIENGLDCLFRHLIKTRALLLNLMSL